MEETTTQKMVSCKHFNSKYQTRIGSTVVISRHLVNKHAEIPEEAGDLSSSSSKLSKVTGTSNSFLES